ncbi:MAG TPA: hypothetical protein VF515_01040 [Candidatus Binatia bacterium]|jgi:hypothetical protein
MGSEKGMIRRGGLALIFAFVASALPVHADVTTERSSSILIFPKVVSETSTVDTIIQISNTSNSMVFAHCFYVNAAPLDPTHPPSVSNPPQWQEVDFDIFLTKQQPTHWVASTGRRVQGDAPTDKICSLSFRDCNGAGFDPGAIPPVADTFTGELKCIEVDSSGAPINGNHLKGEATIVTVDGDASKYNAVGIMGLNSNSGSNNGDTTLCLGGGTSESCPTGAEYNACPQALLLDHFAGGASNPAIDELASVKSSVTTELTLVPCTEDFENQIPGRVVVQFLITNEFEELFSTSTTVTCWSNFTLSAVNSVFLEGFLGSRFAQTRMTPATSDQPGFVGVAEEFHYLSADATGKHSRAAVNIHGEGARPNADLIVLPGGF